MKKKTMSKILSCTSPALIRSSSSDLIKVQEKVLLFFLETLLSMGLQQFKLIEYLIIIMIPKATYIMQKAKKQCIW
jgi:hypothetical protein